MTLFDIIFIAVVGLSALAGWIRGGAREVVTLSAFVLSALFALLLLPVTGPFFRGVINPDWIGTVTAVVLVFLAAYFAIHALGVWLRDHLHRSDRLGGLDRGLGVAFGLVRGLLLIGVFHLIFHAATPPERLPHWFRAAKLYGASAAAAKTIQLVLPQGAKVADRIAPRVEDNVRRGVSDDPPPPETRSSTGAGGVAYDQDQRDHMDALVEKSR